jgi:hypothetical protein
MHAANIRHGHSDPVVRIAETRRKDAPCGHEREALWRARLVAGPGKCHGSGCPWSCRFTSSTILESSRSHFA